MTDTAYRPVSYLYSSKGLIARDITDRAPEYTYLTTLNCQVREETSMSSRYGTLVINRNAVTANNYYFSYPVTSLARLTYQGSAWRYAGTSDGSLYRISGNSQGSYTSIYSGMSGKPFDSLITACFETSQPYLFIYDQSVSIKDNGSLSASQLTGIDMSPYTVNSIPYAPLLSMIDSFANISNPYSVSASVTGWGWSNIETLNASSGSMVTDFSQFSQISPAGGGGSQYTPTSSTNISSVSISVPGSVGPQAGANVYGFPSLVPVSGQTVTVQVFGSVSFSFSSNANGNATATYEYSLDSGVTWIPLNSYSNTITGNVVSAGGAATFSVANINTVYLNVTCQATAFSYNIISCSASITGAVITVSNPGAFGPVQNGMVSILNTNTTINVPISTVTAQTLVGGLYTQLLVTTTTAHGLSAGSMIGIYASSSDLVDGFYQVAATPTSNTFTIPFTSATIIGATGGYVTGGASSPYACALSNQYTTPYPSQMTAWGFYQWVPVGSTVSAAITSYSVSAGNVVSFVTASNSFVSGQVVLIAGLSTTIGLQMNGLLFTVASTGSTFTASNSSFTPGAVGSTSDSGTASSTLNSFPIGAWSGTVAASSGSTPTTGTISRTVALDLNQNNQVTDDDLIVLTLLTSAPINVSQIQLQFWVGASNLGNPVNYYTKFISPAYYQQAVAETQLAYSATEQQILADSLNLVTGQPPGSISAQIQPSNISSGAGSWSACYMRRGDFLPVGQAGQPGLNWSNVTGWTLGVTTNTNTGGVTFSVNGLYLQWGYGLSSFAGVGYDYRQTYYNANTGTESSPCPEQTFNEDFGYLASTDPLTVLRQAVRVTGQYSSDPQVTHVRNYRRGGVLSQDWVQVGQIPNITGGGQYVFKDVISDSYVGQAQILVEDNDPPVTSSLVNPIQTTLALSTTQAGLNSAYSTFSPQAVTVNGVYSGLVVNQIVIVGNPSNLEEVAITQVGGTTSTTTTFYAILRLKHNQGEPVNVYAVPRQPCNLCALAYNRVWLAGDKNNPGYLYFSKPGQPENFGPENYLNVSTPSDPINAVINWRGTLFVGTLTTWYVIQGGANPIAQPTGSQHGIVAQQGWTQTEGAIWYRAADGLREFKGSEGAYMSLPVEWVYRNNPLTPLPLADNSQAANDVMCYYNNEVYVSYISLSGLRYRLIYDTVYKRFRNDSLPMTAMLWERDTNTFLGSYLISAGNYAIVQDQVYSMDYDDGGWYSGYLLKNPINIAIQMPYQDLGKPHYPKQWNVIETDVNTQGQVMTTSLTFDDGSVTVPLATASTTSRQKVQLEVNAGLGQQGYRMSLTHTMPVTVAPILYQENVYAAELAAFRYTFDTYWILGGTELNKLVKQCVFDYTSALAVTFGLYADGSTVPYYTFTLPAEPGRATVRVRFPAIKLRDFRMVGNIASGSTGFQMWQSPQLWWKACLESVGYKQADLTT